MALKQNNEIRRTRDTDFFKKYSNIGQRANKRVVETTRNKPNYFAVDPNNKKLYWTTESGYIQRCNYDGSVLEDVYYNNDKPLSGLEIDTKYNRIIVADSAIDNFITINLGDFSDTSKLYLYKRVSIFFYHT